MSLCAAGAATATGAGAPANPPLQDVSADGPGPPPPGSSGNRAESDSFDEICCCIHARNDLKCRIGSATQGGGHRRERPRRHDSGVLGGRDFALTKETSVWRVVSCIFGRGLWPRRGLRLC